MAARQRRKGRNSGDDLIVEGKVMCRAMGLSHPHDHRIRCRTVMGLAADKPVKSTTPPLSSPHFRISSR